MRRIFLALFFVTLSFTSPAEVRTIVDQIHQCQQSKVDTRLEQAILLQEMIQIHEQSLVSWNANTVIQFYDKMNASNWEAVKENCKEFSFDIFMLVATSKKSLFPLLTEKGFPLNESFQIRLNDIHKKIIYDLSYELIKTTRVDYRPYRWLLEISKHPDFIHLPMEVINICRNQVNQKINRYLNFVDHPTCNGLSYWLNGNLEGTLKGEWVKKIYFAKPIALINFLKFYPIILLIT